MREAMYFQEAATHGVLVLPAAVLLGCFPDLVNDTDFGRLFIGQVTNNGYLKFPVVAEVKDV